MGESDDGGFDAFRVGDEGGLDLHGAEAVAGDVDDVVEATDDHEVAVLIYEGSVAGKIPALLFEFAPVNLFKAIVIAVEGAEHGGPWMGHDE